MDNKILDQIAALEKEILKMYYSVPITYSFGSSLLSYKVEYISFLVIFLIAILYE